MFYVLHNSEDGDVRIEELDLDTLLERIRPEEGTVHNVNYYGANGFFEGLPESRDPQMWDPKKLLIIEGKIVVPKPKQVVTEYEIR
jgi:hypothetical protein